jgi:hypothetical protein
VPCVLGTGAVASSRTPGILEIDECVLANSCCRKSLHLATTQPAIRYAGYMSASETTYLRIRFCHFLYPIFIHVVIHVKLMNVILLIWVLSNLLFGISVFR